MIYQVYPRSFKDASGDGVGDLAGVIEKLDYLSGTLGVDALWLSPFYPSPMKDFGYDITDFAGVDPLFGTLEDFDKLLGEAHRKGLRIILDYVPNHTSDEHPWFRESRSSRDDPKRDWYVWRDPKPDGSPPNNWIEETGGSVWEWDEATGQYYLHSHYKEQPDLNWRNTEVREAMLGVLRFWLDLGVDGFRIDVPHMIMKDPDLRDNPPNPNHTPRLYEKQHPNFHSQMHVHDRQHPDLHSIYREIRRLVDSYGDDRVLIGEIEIAPWERWVLYYGEDLDEFHIPFNFELVETPWTAEAVRSFVDSFEAALPKGAWPNYVLGNHDLPRPASRYGKERARVAAMLLLTLRGTPTLYYGDELGMQDVAIPPEEVRDRLDRDPARTPMLWDSKPRSGFSPPGARPPWLPLAPDHEEINVESQLPDPGSTLNLYRRLLACRKASPALLRGTYRAIDAGTEGCFVFLRETGAQRLLVALNFRSEERFVGLPTQASGTFVLSTSLDREGPVDPKGIILRADEGVIVELARRKDRSSGSPVSQKELL